MEKNNTLQKGSLLQGGLYTYKILDILGSGAFGITYLAETKVTIEGPLGVLESNLRVAIKEFFMHDINGRESSIVTCSSKDGIYDDYKRKFCREANNLSRLHHPNIVKVLESFEANNTAYYAMEYCSGGSLDDYINSHGHLEVREALGFFNQISCALEFMHGNKMLHLDLKPSNIMIREDGSLALIDFGLSKQYDQDGVPESSTTIGGGTPGYSPLEQINYHKGNSFAAAIDVYALGATLFKMLAGERPPEASIIFNDGFPADKLEKNNVGRELIEGIAKAMACAKRDRYDSVAQFREALTKIIDKIVDDAPTVVDNIFTTEDTKQDNSHPSSEETILQSDVKVTKKWPYLIFGSFVIIILVALFLFGPRSCSKERVPKELPVVDSTYIKDSIIKAEKQKQDSLRVADSIAKVRQQQSVKPKREEKPVVTKPVQEQPQTKEEPTSTDVRIDTTITESENVDSAIPDELETAIEQNTESAPKPEPVGPTRDPLFMGGDVNQFARWVTSEVIYPVEAIEAGAQGTVYIRFTVNESGYVTNVQVRQNVHPSLDAEAVRVVSSSPKWEPGLDKGRPIWVTYNIPVNFTLTYDKKRR